MITKINKRSNRATIVFFVLCSLLFSIAFTSCNDWLDVLPNNEQVTDDYWKSKEDVEAVIASGYYYMRQCVPTYIKWGELRGGAIYTTNTSDSKLQDFNMTASHSLCDWSNIYKVIGMANSVILYAPGVEDNTYYDAIRNSHLAEAYFMRAYSYLLLVKNFKEVPLVLSAYVNDNASFDLAKSTEAEIIAQIKSDVKKALETGAAKGTYEEDWATKGRATKWALYALMADACLWSEDYDQCIEYCNMILNATDNFRPVFMSNTSDWYTIFYPGNSNESIMELNWDYSSNQQNNNFSTLFTMSTTSPLRLTTEAVTMMRNETQALKDKGFTEDGRMGRMLLATYVPDNAQLVGWPTANQYYIWKYYGTDVQDITGGARVHQDANFILYRVAEIMLMKAQALAMKGQDSWQEAINLINRVRNRAGLDNFDVDVSELDELTLLEEILDQKEMEFIAEGKRWYDLLWFGRIDNNKYKKQFINKIIESNQTTNQQWILSVLQDPNAWYMPLPQADIEHNKLLVQNPYYSSTK
ncbi:MAG: RagB/SusD family nutrient uptake outer membrane protein [Prevotella sp.]|nr:RagB/SusD family nutrient uptake outer membrane protein [Prevotella sp.]